MEERNRETVVVRGQSFEIELEEGPRSWGMHVPSLPGCYSVGSTREAVIELAKEAIDLHLDALGKMEKR